MFWLILFLPLLSALCLGFFGRYIGWKGSILLSIGNMIIVVINSLLLFYNIGLNSNPYTFKVGVWLNSEEFIVYWGFLIDSLTTVMLLVVSIISLFVHLFSSEYMKEDPHLPRFMAYLSIFTFFMLILISSDNLIQFFLGWEGVGICSYLLINFWFTRIQANKSAIKALVVNKIGDICFLLGIILIFIYTKTVDFKVIFSLLPFFELHNIYIMDYQFSPLTLGSIFLVIGAIGKSAQLGLHTWLPDAMEGPTPVSALIHAATMVTAGIFLLIRTSPILESSNPAVLSFVTLMGALTCFIFALVGVYQQDLKKIIAYSTCSQLGYMFFICGTSNYSASIFHIATHAFFKALLFLTAGALLHSLNDEQDIRKMGGLMKYYPFYGILFIIGSLSLAGFPFLSGFFSKDLILEIVNTTYVTKGNLSWLFGNLAAYFSFYYSLRLLDYVFLGSFRGNKKNIVDIHQPSNKYYFLLSILCLFSIFFGYFSFDLFFGTASQFFNNAIYLDKNIVMDNELLPFYIKEAPLFLVIVGLFRYEYMFTLYTSTKNYFNNYKINKFFKMRFAFDYLYNIYLSNFAMNLGFFYTFKNIDKIFFELFGPFSLIKLVSNLMFRFSQLQTGFLSHYFGFMFLIGFNFLIFLS